MNGCSCYFWKENKRLHVKEVYGIFWGNPRNFSWRIYPWPAHFTRYPRNLAATHDSCELDTPGTCLREHISRSIWFLFDLSPALSSQVSMGPHSSAGKSTAARTQRPRVRIPLKPRNLSRGTWQLLKLRLQPWRSNLYLICILVVHITSAFISAQNFPISQHKLILKGDETERKMNAKTISRWMLEIAFWNPLEFKISCGGKGVSLVPLRVSSFTTFIKDPPPPRSLRPVMKNPSYASVTLYLAVTYQIALNSLPTDLL